MRTVEAPEPSSQACASQATNSMERTHLVQCTPGSAGTMTRAGKPWSSERSTPLTLQGQQRVRVQYLVGLQPGLAEPSALLERLHVGRAGRGHPGQPGQIGQPDAAPRWVVAHPSTQAMGSSAACCSMARSDARLTRTDRAPPLRASCQPAPVASGLIDAASAVRLIWKSLGPFPYDRPRGSNRAALRATPAEALPHGQHGHHQRSASHHGQRPPSAECRLVPGGGHQSVGVQRLRPGVGQRGSQLGPKRTGPQASHHGAAT